MRFWSLFLILLFLGCSAKVVNVDPEVKELNDSDLHGVMSLLAVESIGHACPVNGRVYTAKHNVYNYRAPESKQETRGFAWEDGHGNKGIAHTLFWSSYFDLAMLITPEGEPEFYERGENPESGSTVRWVEYSRVKEEAFNQEIGKAKVIHSIAGYIFLDELPTPGSSGSCLIDESGKAIGVIVWGLRPIGVGVAVELPQ